MVEGTTTKFDYSRLDLFQRCPLSFKWKYVDARVPKTPPNMYYAFPGIVIQKIFEHFYNDEWFRKRAGCRPFMYDRTPEIFEKTLKWVNVDWQSKIAKKTKKEVYLEIVEMVGKNLDLIKEKKLLGKFAKSEYKIRTFFGDNKYVVLSSKIDFLIYNDDGMQILDGKATSNKRNYIKNPTQLFFYAMMHKFKYGKYPDKIGYWFWRDAKLVYIDFDKSKIDVLRTEIDDALYKIFKKKFDPTPSYKNCLFCNYKDECLERKKHIAVTQDEKLGKISSEDLNSFL